MTEEIYPMPMFPILVVDDLEASSTFYQQALGFTHIFTMPGPGGKPALAHLRWVKYADVLLGIRREGQALAGPKGAGVSLNFNLSDRFGGRIDTFAEHARAHGAQVSGPVSQPWNVREVTIVDPDGYRLVFTVPENIGMGFDKVIDRASKGS